MRLRQDVQPRELILRSLRIRYHSDRAAAVSPPFALAPAEGLGDGGTEVRVCGDGVIGVEAVVGGDDGEEGVDEAPGFIGWGDEGRGRGRMVGG